MELLVERGADVAYHDPHIPEVPRTREYADLMGRRSVSLDEATVSGFDLVLVSTDHDNVDYAAIAAWAPLIIDTRNVFARRNIATGNIFKA